MRNLQRYDAVKLRIARTPDRAECSLAHALEELKSPEQANFCDRGNGVVILDAERAAALVALELITRLCVEGDWLVTVGTAEDDVGIGPSLRFDRLSVVRIKHVLMLGTGTIGHATNLRVPSMTGVVAKFWSDLTFICWICQYTSLVWIATG